MDEQLFVLGHPVSHSKSPVMHNAAYAALGLPWHYGLADCANQAEAQDFIAHGGWLALNVTMPYKPLALECAGRASAAAQLAHGANVLVRHGGELHADNVDGAGCVAFLKRCDAGPEGLRVAICGTGPTSLSIMHACIQAGAAHVSLLGRDAGRAKAAVDAYVQQAVCIPGLSLRAKIASGSYADGSALLSKADIIVDATPLGMNEGDPAPFDTALLSAGQTVMDVVYGHGVTALVAAARAAGCAVFDGAGMLVGQAVETVRVVAELTGLFAMPDDLDLFAIMSQAAGFAPIGLGLHPSGER